jgi:hypothetical protein
MDKIKKHINFHVIIQTLIAAGVITIIFQTGVYVNKFDSLIVKFNDYQTLFDNHMKQNEREFKKVENAIISITGKPIQ